MTRSPPVRALRCLPFAYHCCHPHTSPPPSHHHPPTHPEAEYKPDGGYIPRILFLTPGGEVMKEVVNAGGNPKYQYYYGEPRSIVTAMADAKVQAAARAARAGSGGEL